MCSKAASCNIHLLSLLSGGELLLGVGKVLGGEIVDTLELFLVEVIFVRSGLGGSSADPLQRGNHDCLCICSSKWKSGHKV